MTTQELKQQIDKVLGNSIRCLLPSYWWKRIFGLLVEEIGGKASRTVEDKVRVNAADISNLRSRVNNLENEDDTDIVPHILLYIPAFKYDGVPQWDNAKYTALNAAAIEKLAAANKVGKEGYTIQLACVFPDGLIQFLHVDRMYYTSKGQIIVLSSPLLGEDTPDYAIQTLHVVFSLDGSVQSTSVDGKQDAIADLETIRSGAALGATALQSVPSTYATKTDVDNAIAAAITTTLNTAV